MQRVASYGNSWAEELGWKPWALSAGESLVHVIPIIGWATSTVAWCATNIKVHRLEKDYEDKEGVEEVAVNFHLMEEKPIDLVLERDKVKNRRALAITHLVAIILFGTISAIVAREYPNAVP